MEHAGATDPRAEMFRIRGQDAKRLVCSLEQSIVEPPLVGTSKRMKSVRDREDDVKVGNREELLSASLKPLHFAEILAFGTVAIAARIIEVDLGLAGIATQ